MRTAISPIASLRFITCRSRKIDPATGDTMTRLSEADRIVLEAAASSPPEELAFALDQARNNESVVALLSYRGKNLLFAGDAQYGNWRWWLENERPDQILPGVSFFKVAHHGSVNATPKVNTISEFGVLRDRRLRLPSQGQVQTAGASPWISDLERPTEFCPDRNLGRLIGHIA
jgi:hypothetical protein